MLRSSRLLTLTLPAAAPLIAAAGPPTWTDLFPAEGVGSGGDAHGNGTIDLADLNAVLAVFGTNCP